MLVQEAGTCQFMDSAANVVIEGCTSIGKSYLGCCIAKQACKMRGSSRYMAKSTMLCTQYTPAEWHGQLGGGVQANAMVDHLVHGSVRINLDDMNVRKLRLA